MKQITPKQILVLLNCEQCEKQIETRLPNVKFVYGERFPFHRRFLFTWCGPAHCAGLGFPSEFAEDDETVIEPELTVKLFRLMGVSNPREELEKMLSEHPAKLTLKEGAGIKVG